MSDAIRVDQLVKTFGRTRALDGLDLSISTGEVHGLLGPNGAGKTTTIRALLGLIRADSGSAQVLGGDPWADAVTLHERLAYVPGEVNLWSNLTGGEAIDLFGGLRGNADKARREQLVERFKLDPTKRCRTYSKGNRQKVALVAAFSSNVELFILDEPTSGLDPLMEAAFQETVREVNRAGATVLLSSHIFAGGRGALFPGQHHPRGQDRGVGHAGRVAPPHPHLGRRGGGRSDHRPGRPARRARPQARQRPGPVRRGLGPAGRGAAALAAFDVRSLTSQPPTLEELFMRHYGDAVAVEPITDGASR
jgi:ABC-2 type transport system ATP-binding protein